ncbi:SIR2 family protein (plasmid) [Rhodococcus aetherivorans]|uniref:SIR2 family protein n=1 Tax=Rhodococcus aetherivorans TaxID=191292 RepID=A0AA46NZ01_9NOCA|nr:SIR2 family protein [Rhodococcus aetherivorans]UYF97169.1 SIR2 family protein [Rhodococcus aetherivorans]
MGVLLGAGASAAAGLPDWNTFAVELLTRSGAITDRDTAKAFLGGQDPAIVAEAAKDAAGNTWPSLLESALYGETPVDPAALHYAAAALAEKRGPETISLFTLNYDELLEVALHNVLDALGRSTGVFSRGKVRPRAPHGDYEVHHLHGFLPPGASADDSVVLTLSDYNKLGQRQVPWQVSALQETLQKGPLILAGTSYRDPDIRQWIHDLTSEDRDAEVLVFLAREGMGLDRTQFERVEMALKNQWSALGVHVIATHDYTDAAQALREFPHLGEDGYLTPRERASALWEKNVSQFSMLQQGDSNELEQDLAILQEMLPDLGNLTLWLTDGTGGLVRWAANDRTYKHPNHLRREVPGHDSPWIAGQCIGRNDLLIRELSRPGSTSRWHSVAATPVVAELPGGPALPCGVISAASTTAIDDAQIDEVNFAFAELSEKWSELLQTRMLSL